MNISLRYFVAVLSLLSVSCITSNSLVYSGADLAVSCHDDFNLQVGSAKGIECKLQNRSSAGIRVVVKSVSPKPEGFQILKADELEEIVKVASESANAHHPTSAGSVMGLGAAQNSPGSAGGAIVGAIVNQTGATSAQVPNYAAAHLASTEPVTISQNEILKRYLYIQASSGSLPESITLCLSAPREECLDVPVIADPIRSRHR